jgi:hypothetical protein
MSSSIATAQESAERLRDRAMAIREDSKAAAAERREKWRAAELEKESMKQLENAERMARQTKERENRNPDHMRDHGSKPKNPLVPDKLRPQAEKLEMATQRIHHLRVAAEHLKIAEAHDLAHQLMEKAEAMERDVQEERRRLLEEVLQQRRAPEGMEMMQDLRAEVAKLRAEIKELRAKLSNRDE